MAAKVERLPERITRGSILNWETTNSREPKELAHAALQAAVLSNLVTAGYTLQDGGTGPGKDIEVGFVRECAELSALLSFVLARELGALDDDEEGGE